MSSVEYDLMTSWQPTIQPISIVVLFSFIFLITLRLKEPIEGNFLSMTAIVMCRTNKYHDYRG